MKSLSVALLESDASRVRALSASLGRHFYAIHAPHSYEELRETIAKHRVQVVIADLETASLCEIERLHREFTGIAIVCTHRLADEEMWTAALNAGASDICSSSNTESIVTAALRNSPNFARPAAA